MSQSSWIAQSQAEDIKFSQEDFFNPKFLPIDPVALNFDIVTNKDESDEDDKDEDDEALTVMDARAGIWKEEEQEPAQQDNETKLPAKSTFQSSIVLNEVSQNGKAAGMPTGARKPPLVNRSRRFPVPHNSQERFQRDGCSNVRENDKNRIPQYGRRKGQQDQSRFGRPRQIGIHGRNAPSNFRKGPNGAQQSQNAGQDNSGQNNRQEHGRKLAATANPQKQGRKLAATANPQKRTREPQWKTVPLDVINTMSSPSSVNNNSGVQQKPTTTPNASYRPETVKQNPSSNRPAFGQPGGGNPKKPWSGEQQQAQRYGRGRGSSRGGGRTEERDKRRREDSTAVICELTECKLQLEEKLRKAADENEKLHARVAKTELENVTVWQKLNDIETEVERLRIEEFQSKDRLKVQARDLAAKVEEQEKSLKLAEERIKRVNARNLELKNKNTELRGRIKEMKMSEEGFGISSFGVSTSKTGSRGSRPSRVCKSQAVRSGLSSKSTPESVAPIMFSSSFYGRGTY